MSYAHNAAQWDWLTQAQSLAATGQPFALVTVIHHKGSTPRAAGAKLLVDACGKFYGTVGGGQLEELVLRDAAAHLQQASLGTHDYPLCFKTNQCCGGAVEVLIEIIGCGPQLYLFGAGHVGQALSQTLAGTPFAVHLIDARPDWIHNVRLPSQVYRHPVAWQQFMETVSWSKELTYVAIMTHDHQMDLEIVQQVITKPARFIGLIGSKTKLSRFTQRLRALGCEPDQIGRVRCPIGINIGGKAPQEIAISAASQLLATYYEQRAGHAN